MTWFLIICGIITLFALIGGIYTSKKIKQGNVPATPTQPAEPQEKSEFWKKLAKAVGWIIVILLIVVLVLWIIWWFRPPVVSVANTTAPTATVAIPKPVETKWQLCWTKGPDIKGLNPEMRVIASNVGNVINDGKTFSFVQYYYVGFERREASFFWDKTKKYGEWSQTKPPGNGIWWLAPDPYGSTNSYHGQVLDRLTDNEFIPMWLRTVEK
jgi:hypothetical protein